MGVRAGVVVCVTSFLLGKYLCLIPGVQHSYHRAGALFTHWIADSLTLWKSPVTDEHLWTAAAYYSIITKGPSVILYLFAAVVLLGGVTILWSLNDLRAGNIMFDGGSICESSLLMKKTLVIVLLPIYHPFVNIINHFITVLFGTTIIMYLNSVLPSEFLPDLF